MTPTRQQRPIHVLPIAAIDVIWRLTNHVIVSWYSLGMRALEYRPGHFHANLNGEGSYSWNVHEVGRFIAEDGSNFWGVHVDEIDGQQVILASDRNTGLWVFTFDCGGAPGPFYCDGGID